MSAVDEREHAADGVVGRDSVLERDEAPEPVELGVAEALDGEEAVGTGDHGAEDEGEDVRERVALAEVAAGVGDEVEVASEQSHERRGGWKPLLRARK